MTAARAAWVTKLQEHYADFCNLFAAELARAESLGSVPARAISFQLVEKLRSLLRKTEYLENISYQARHIMAGDPGLKIELKPFNMHNTQLKKHLEALAPELAHSLTGGRPEDRSKMEVSFRDRFPIIDIVTGERKF